MSKIHKEIESFGGKVIKIQRKKYSTGPFLPAGNLIPIYRIEFSFKDNLKEGWVKFVPFSEPDWRL